MLRAVIYLLAWFATVFSFVAPVARYVPGVNHAVLIVAALSPHLTIGASTLAALLLFSTSPRLAVAALLPAVAAAAIQLPLSVRTSSFSRSSPPSWLRSSPGWSQSSPTGRSPRSPTPPGSASGAAIRSNGPATDMETVPVPGSDHLGVTATIHVPRQVNTG